MPVSFPTTKRYFVSFRNGDVGLTPTYPIFTYYKNALTLAPITPPTFTELSNGTYYFTVPFAAATDPDIIFQIDGGPSIPTEEIRYQTSMASPKDLFIDEPTSQVKTDVWTDNTVYAPGQKGRRVDDIGEAADISSVASLFGKMLLYKESIRGDSAGSSDGENVKLARDRVMGGTGFGGTGENVMQARDRIMGGTGFGGTGVDVKTVNDALTVVDTNVDDIETLVGTINTKLGTPVANVSTDIANVKVDVLAVKAKTDNLPSDPASQATTNTSIANSVTSIQGVGGPTLLAIGGTGFTSPSNSLVSIVTAIGAIPAPNNADIALIKAKTDTIGLVGDVSGASSLFGKIYDARDSVKGGSPGVDLTQIAGTGFSSATMSLKASHDTLLRVTGMLHENSVLDGCQFDPNNNLTSARLRLYTNSASASAAQAIPFPGIYDTNKIAEYTITATYTGSNLTTYLVTKV